MNTNNFIVSNKQMELDLKLVPYDLWASQVHCLMLFKQKIIKRAVAQKIFQALCKIQDEYKQGQFTIDSQKGLHLTIEAKLVEKIGDSGFFLHTARSRNDQVMVAEMLYLREKLLVFLLKLLKLLKLLIYLSGDHLTTVMPGYTHMQPAKPTTFGQWLLSYFDMLVRCFDTFIFCYKKYDFCPLGSVESYGTSWPIERNFTAHFLGFFGVWEIGLEAISSRGFFQMDLLGELKNTSIVVSKLAQDLMLFNTFEYGLIALSSASAKQMDPVTGSSIMPQKKNPDVLELIRATAAQTIGFEMIVSNLLSGLPMGYNRDSREVKEYIEAGFEKTEHALSSLIGVLEGMRVNKEKMYQSVLANYSLSTDLADYIAQKTSLPYRKVYKLVGLLVKEKIEKGVPITDLKIAEVIKKANKLGLEISLTERNLKEALDPLQAIGKRTHIGGTAPAVMKKMIGKRKKWLQKHNKWLEDKWETIKKAKNKTEKEVQVI